MTVSVLLEGTLKDGERDGFTALLTEKFKLTKTFDGFQTIDLTYNVEDPNNWVITELWDSKGDVERSECLCRRGFNPIRPVGAGC